MITAMGIPESVAADLLAKCGRCCCICRRFAPLHLHIHHIIEVADGGTDDPDNLIPICLTCHSDVHTKTKLTRRFTPNELKQHRDSVFQLVADGKLPAGPHVDPMATFSPSAAIEIVMPSASSLPALAVDFLVKAAQGDGSILVINAMRSFGVHAGGQPVVETSEARTKAECRHAIEQLEDTALIESRKEDYVFSVTHEGFLLADELIAAGTT